VNARAVMIARIATGEESEDLPTDDGKDPAARALGKKGGAARAKEQDAGETEEDRSISRRNAMGQKRKIGFA
jgi:hypothetical protein